MTRKSERGQGEAPHSGIAPRLAQFLPVAFTLALTSACLLPPPIEPEPPDVNYPPYIDRAFVDPPEELLILQGSRRLSVTRVLDPNPEAELHYAWYVPTIGVLSASTLQRLGQERDARGIFYVFGGAEQTIDPCNPSLAGVDHETIWFYVSDRPWQRTDQSGVFEQQDGYKVAYAWALEFNVVCNGSL